MNITRVLLIYRQRLGDIVGCLPAAYHLAKSGHEVEFCCFPQYHSIFKAVSYCRPVGPEALGRRSSYQKVFDLEISRREYDAYRASPLKWRDYVYAKYPELEPARTSLPYFDRLRDIGDYQLPTRYDLAAPRGISQVPHVNGKWFQEQCLAISPGPWYILTDRSQASDANWGTPLRARSLEDLPSLIAGADKFVTVNSAPNIIAAGVRKSWHQIYEAGFGGQSNYEAPGQIVLHQPPELARYSWRFWIHYWRRRLMGLATENDFGK